MTAGARKDEGSGLNVADMDIDRDGMPSLAERVRGAVIWRSGSQIVAQIVTWTSTFMVIRLLDPSDYGLFAMTQVVLVLLNLMNGGGFADALVQRETIDKQQVRQVFGLLILLNTTLAAIQFLAAPLAAAYFRQPAVADLLRVQALLYLSTPLIVLPTALLGREIDFRRQAIVNLISAALGAATALGCAYGGMGVWTLVAAPMVLWWTRAIGMTVAARTLVWPSFRFKGAGPLIRYGSAMVAVQFCWFLQSQADIFIGGRVLSTHNLGLYTTALFLTQILAAKFVPTLNEVAFAAYSRMQGRRDAMGLAFLRSVRLIMLVALPFYLGLAVTADDLVLTVLGPKWAQAAAIVPVLAVAMPFLTLQILFAPATNAIGKPGIALRTGIAGALILPIAFVIGLGWGIAGLAIAWLGGIALLCLVTALLSLPEIGVGRRALAVAVAPGLFAALAMAALVAGLRLALPPLGVESRLLLLVAFGAAAYACLLVLFARPVVADVMTLVRPRRRLAAQAL
ncbi:lipopolysaccharide biosynthesis protein [Allosphingosinicella sp.]|jgi:O-antigen/teichoic acid export membrane protein|uniref:lipopolysaccharide biosynthesis protein n=1 Tax=Allosphingosinicella sp. TaxID=2823234 RepID=UPI002EE82AC7